MNTHTRLDRSTVGFVLAGAGVDAWGVATNAPRLPYAPDLPVAISLVMRLDPAALTGLRKGPTAAYLAAYRRLNEALDAATAILVDTLHEHGRQAIAIPATRHGSYSIDPSDLDPAGDLLQFPHKTAATQAGLGWIGKTALFVSEEFGPAVRLATVFTDLPLAAGRPVASGRCGTCHSCLDVCPAACGRDVTWQAGMTRDELFDAPACERYMRTQPEVGEVCGMCVGACPYSGAA
jgi:epoxyqueuosine reductase